MPQETKHAPQSGRPAAERQFVDREELIAIFQAALKAPQCTKPLVLVFHGGAGTGKSRLRRELARSVHSGSPEPPNPGTPEPLLRVLTATLDFDIPIHGQPDAALLYLRKAIGEGYKAGFPGFDLAYAILWQKTHPDTAMGLPPLSAEENGGCTEQKAMAAPREELDPLLEPGSLLSQLLDESGKLPLIGLVPRIAALVSERPKTEDGRRGTEGRDSPTSYLLPPNYYATWWRERGEREFEDLPQMEPAAIVEQLPKLWAVDLKESLVHRSSLIVGRRAVLFIDSYEKLRGAADEGPGTRDEGQKTDAWVRELVKQLPEVLWVISGRQRLRWEEAEKEWVDVLSQHELGALPEHSARQFLSSCGITDEPIQDAVAKGSQGLPHYLNLAVDTFLEIKQAGQRVPDTSASPSTSQAGTPEELFTQFIRHLDQPEIATLQILSASRFWNYGLFEHLVTEYQTGYPLTAYDDLSRFSFIGEGAAPETRTMHDLMREALQEHQAPELRKRVHLFLHEYYAKQIEDLDVKGITDRHKAALNEAFYHGRRAKSAAELWLWFVPVTNVFAEAERNRQILPLYREMIQALEAELGGNHPDTATALLCLGIILVNVAEHGEAEPLYRRALEIAETGQGPEHPDYMTILHMLAVLLRDRGRLDEAEALSRRMVGLLEERPGRDAAMLVTALDILAQVLTLECRYVEAEELLHRAHDIFENELGPDHELATSLLVTLSILSQAQGRYSEAEALSRRRLAILEKKWGTNTPRVVMCRADLGVDLRELGRYAEAEALHRQTLKQQETIYGPHHPFTANALSNLAGVLYSLGRYAEAEPLHRRALAVHEKKWGPDSDHTFGTAFSLTMVLGRQGKFAEAEPMALSLVADREEKRGPDHPETADALRVAGMVFGFHGRHTEAEGYLRRALDIKARMLGPEHPDTLISLDGLALTLEQQGKYAEAESLCRDVLEKRTRVLGPDHPDVADTANRLAGVCGRDGRYTEAEALYRRALAIREKVFGPDHPFTAETLEGLAKVCEQTGRSAEAQELSARAARIHAQAAPAPNNPQQQA